MNDAVFCIVLLLFLNAQTNQDEKSISFRLHARKAFLLIIVHFVYLVTLSPAWLAAPATGQMGSSFCKGVSEVHAAVEMSRARRNRSSWRYRAEAGKLPGARFTRLRRVRRHIEASFMCR
jgi:hypothetical protein